MLSSLPQANSTWNHHRRSEANHQKQTWLSISEKLNGLVFLPDMEQIRQFEPWLSSLSIWMNPAYIFTNATTHFYLLKENIVHLWNTDDWQIRLSWFLLACTLLNMIFIAIAWNIYSETISNIFLNKPKSSAHQRLNTNANALSNSMEELIVKKIQWCKMKLGDHIECRRNKNEVMKTQFWGEVGISRAKNLLQIIFINLWLSSLWQ